MNDGGGRIKGVLAASMALAVGAAAICIARLFFFEKDRVGH